MRVTVTLEQRFDATPDGAIWTPSSFALPFWSRYLDVFSQVQVVARVREVPAPPAGARRSDGPDVRFLRVPHYLGMRQFVTRYNRIRAALDVAFEDKEAVVLRLASPIAGIVSRKLERTRYPYGVEVVGDPYDVFAPGVVKHPLRPFLRWHLTRQLRRQCQRACATAFVSERSLQRRYPSAPYALSTHYSSVELAAGSLLDAPRPRSSFDKSRFRLTFVGSLAQLYKAPDVLIDAVAQCVSDGLDLSLTIVGDGTYRNSLEARETARQLGDRIAFAGELPGGDAVREQLDRSDLFVLPSRTEGLPRAMIEAMARALPCVGSSAGGIPELLPPEDLVPPGDPIALAARIREFVTSTERLAIASARNLVKARDYREDVLRERRIRFYQHVQQCTLDWTRKVNGR